VFPGDQSTHALAPATGFVSTAADLVRFFGQLSPNAEKSLLSVESRREMSRQQWKDPWSPFDVGYGLGTMSGRFDGWDWFGHGGGFQGYLTRTATIPAEHLTVSCLTNAADGASTPWLDGILSILKRFHDAGPPAAELADWTGRWWSVWGPGDLVPVGDKVLLATPGLAHPLLKVPEVTVSGPDEGRISQAGGFGSFGEPVRLIRGPDGALAGVQLAGTLMVREADLAAELTARYEGLPA
jgi:Beta-lactamase